MGDFPFGTRVGLQVGGELVTGRIGAGGVQGDTLVYFSVDYGQNYASRWIDKDKLQVLPPATDIPLLKVYEFIDLTASLVVAANDEREAKMIFGGAFPLLPLPAKVTIWQGVVATGEPRILLSR